jgi:O-antigen ligase
LIRNAGVGLTNNGPVREFQATGESRIFRRLKFLFFVYVISVYYAPPLGGAGSGSYNIRPDLLVMLFGIAIMILAYRGLPRVFRTEWVAVWLGLYFLSSLITALISGLVLGGEVGAIIGPVTGVLKPLMVYLVFTFWVRRASGVQRLKLIYWGIALAMPLMLLAIGQFVNFANINSISQTYYGRRVDVGGRDVQNMLLVGRVYATFDGQPNNLGTFSAITAVCCGVTALYLRRRLLLQIILFLFFGLTLVGLLLSWSRGAMGGLAAGLLLVIMLTNPLRSVKIVLTILLFIVAVVPLMPSTAIMRVTELATLRSQRGTTIYEDREALWRGNIELWSQDPLFGVMGGSRPPPDNLAVGLGSLTGISGLLLMSAALGTAFWKGLSQFRKWSRADTGRGDPEARAKSTLYLIGAVATLVVVVNGASTNTILEARVLEVYWALVAIVFAPYRASIELQVETSNTSDQADSAEEPYA